MKSAVRDVLQRYPVVLVLLTLNVAMFVLTGMIAGAWEGPQWSYTLMEAGALFNPLTLDGQWYRVFASMFLHAHLGHLVMNMVALYFVGRDMEWNTGSLKFFLVYLVTGAAAALASLYWNLFIFSVGASGAIFGLFGFSVATNLILGRRKGDALMPILVNLLIFLTVNVVLGEAFQADHAAHFGGFVMGAALAAFSLSVAKDFRQLRSEIVAAIALCVVYFLMPRYQVDYYKFFRQVIAAENGGKHISSIKATDEEFVRLISVNNERWDSAAYLLRSLEFVPPELSADTFTLGQYIRFREKESNYRIEMLRDERYILMDSLEIVQDSIGKYLILEHPLPVHTPPGEESEADSSDAQAPNPSALERVRVWYDSNWIETGSPSVYFRVGYRDSLERWEGPVQDYYADGTIQMKGVYHKDKRDGIFLYYSHHNTYTAAGRYVDNRSVGKWQTFHNNGRLASEIVYGSGVFYKNIWDSTGAIQVSNGFGQITEHWPDGQLKTEGNYENGRAAGTWTGWHRDGTMHYKELYREGTLLHGRARDMKGREYIYDGSSLTPQPRGGYAQFRQYLDKEAAKFNGEDRGTVRLSFRVTASGLLTDFEIDESVSPAADQKAISIVREWPSWEPAKLHGYIPTDGYYRVEVNF